MSHSIDISELKQRVTIEQAAEWLGLTVKKSGGQLRGVCPVCKDGGDRALVITPAKGLHYCFGKCRKGGDAISLAASVRGCTLREAAAFLAEKAGGPNTSDSARHTSPQPRTEEGRLKPLDYLQAEHEAVQALGVSAGTCRHFGAGFAPKGIMRGRLAIPVHDRAGVLLAYCGRAVKDEEPRLIFPKDFDPRAAIFNAHRITEGDLILVRDPLQVLTAFENGIENVVAFLTEGIGVTQLEQLVALMEGWKCSTLEIF